MTGLSASTVGTAKFITSFPFFPHFDSTTSISVTALVVKSISSNIPSELLQKDAWTHLNNLQLADPDFHVPGFTDILLGTEIVWTLLENEKVEGGSGQPFAVKSTLGWLVAGPNHASHQVTVFNTKIDLEHQLRRFWEQEEMAEETVMSTEERNCEAHFAETHKRDHTGRFAVSLPLKVDRGVLGASRQQAVRRFLSMENKFVHLKNIRESEKIRKLQDQWGQYKEFMREYEELGHMSPIPASRVTTSNATFYIPHHSVLKESSTTTKLRVVFDASASSSNGLSLNEIMMTGPKLQDSIWEIMLRFRTHPIAFTADIAKMYRQIVVSNEDRDLQRIVWRDDPGKPLTDYWLNTVTYGTTSAPYLAVKCLQQLALDEQLRYPLASKIALRDFYMDDAASGSNNLEAAIATVRELRDLCKSGGFELRKWTSNSRELINTIPEDLRETSSQVEFSDNLSIKTLGVFWSTSTDEYFFKLNLSNDTSDTYTKRIVLSEIAKIYDPLGWLAPTIISCKIFMQTLWKVKCDWDDSLPVHLQDSWREMKKDLKDLETITIPRCVIPNPSKSIILVGCSDASTKAMSACVYICCYEGDKLSCNLLTAKTKVAPVKHVTLPRLELNAAVLLSEVMKSSIQSLQLEFEEVRALSDSTITIHWINSDPSKWKLYVKRRVQMIQNNLPGVKWYHIPGQRNPADCASRGITANELLHHHLWWTGEPEYFSNSIQPAQLLESEFMEVEKEAHHLVHHLQPSPLPKLFSNYSSFTKLQRVVAYIFRFLNNWVRPTSYSPVQKGSLTVHEIQTAHNFIIRNLQQSCFHAEHEALKEGQSLPRHHHLLRLQPFVSGDGLIRVGGRLRHAQINFDRRHPILLPKGHFITTAIIRDIHEKHLHAGPSATLAILQQRYWITNGRDNVRATIRKCIICVRHRADLMTQVMGDLPFHRINISPPFMKTGVDYAGPFSLRPMVRSRVTLKCWLAIFVCLVTKGIHIEVVSSLSTDCFLAALRRFISRRGRPSDIFSDCGTNFKGADKVLRDFFVLSRQKQIQDECAVQKISWHFNPPGAPHFGGLWEAGVKSIKYHLTRVMGSSTLTYEEMLTLVNQIEAILNSRPLIPASADPSDLGALTPAHFINGAPLTVLPEPVLVDHKENYLRRWEVIQQRQQLFWKRWSNEYLTRLQQRPKWMIPCPELEVGHLVIIKEERLPPLKWKLGRVISVSPGADKHVRVATLRTVDGEITRPVVKLVLLPISNH